MVDVLVVGETADETPGGKAEDADQREREPGIDRQPHAQIIGDGRDHEGDEDPDDDAHGSNRWLSSKRPSTGFRHRIDFGSASRLLHACKVGKDAAIENGAVRIPARQKK